MELDETVCFPDRKQLTTPGGQTVVASCCNTAGARGGEDVEKPSFSTSQSDKGPHSYSLASASVDVSAELKRLSKRKQSGAGRMTAHRLIVQDVGGSAETHLVLVTIMAPRARLLITAAARASRRVCACVRTCMCAFIMLSTLDCVQPGVKAALRCAERARAESRRRGEGNKVGQRPRQAGVARPPESP